jgi:WD40 repeat protein
LISGGADKKIIVWDVTTGERLHTIRDKLDSLLAIQHIAIDPVDSTADEIIFATSSSDPKIRRWRTTLTAGEQILEDADSNAAIVAKTDGINEHETSVYRLLFDSDYGDLWSASADGNAKCLSRSRAWATEDTFEQGDYVRSVALTPDWVITAGRNEDVKVWDRNTGKLRHVYDGHFEEVTGLAIMKDGRQVVSVSIDGTVRTWPLDKVSLENAIKEKEERDKGVVKEEPVVTKGLMTADEEAELAELMDDSD